VHTYILGPKLLQWNFLQISQLATRSRARNLFRLISTFRNFWTQFRETFGDT